MLQKGLPKEFRERFSGILFKKYVSEDEASFAAELYLSLEQIKSMRDAGMYIGNHGYDHFWFDQLTPAEQEADIDAAQDFLCQIGAPAKDWIMCYPYGNFDESLLDLLRRRGCSVGLTVQVGIAHPGEEDPLLLPRLDTNDLPKDGNAQPNTWTDQA